MMSPDRHLLDLQRSVSSAARREGREGSDEPDGALVRTPIREKVGKDDIGGRTDG